MSTRVISALVVSLLAIVGAAGCGGGGGGIPAGAVAQVGDTAITTAELNHWMSTLVGGDFYEVGRGHPAPAGLVSEPPNYARCVASLEAAMPRTRAASSTPGSSPASDTATHPNLLVKCHQLYQALRFQTAAYLVNARWTTAVYADLGITASDADVQRLLAEVKEREFPKPGQFEQYLAINHRSLADELFVLRLNVLSNKLARRAHAEGTRAVIRRLSEAGQKWTAKTECRPGYVVQHCRQFRKVPEKTPDPGILLEQVATITGVPCVNHQACG
jgi:hypothetical protein